MYLGIDLGTSNSAVVGYIDGQLRLFKTSDGSDVLPSVIYVDRRGHRFVGKSAYDRTVTSPQSVASGFKRLMGTRSPVRINNEEWTPEDCSAEVIRTLISQANTESGEKNIEGVVITIPAAFNQMQSEATVKSARAAGLDKVSLIQEPVAAAIAAIAKSSVKDGVFLIYDLGGGTFDVALVISTAGSVNVIAHEGINMLGGRDFDRRIFDSIVRPWLVSNFNLPEHFQKDPAYRHLTTISHHAIERAKIQLSASNSASIFASEDDVRMKDLDGNEIYLGIDTTRDTVTTIIQDRVLDTVALCRKVIADNGYRAEDISKIVPIGGPSKMPLIRELLQSELAIEVEQTLDPMTAVAMGAAIFAESRVWEDTHSTRKTSRSREEVRGNINLVFDYPARVTSGSARLSVKSDDSNMGRHWIEVVDENGTTTGRSAIDGPLRIPLALRHDGENRFKITVSGEDGFAIPDLSREITITRAPASAASIPMTYTLAVKTQVGTVGYERNKLTPLVVKGTALPAEGRQPFRSGKTLRGGTADTLNFEFFDMATGVDDPEKSLHIGDFRLNAETDLTRGERISRGSDLFVHWRMSDNGTLSFAVESPEIGRVIDAPALYFVEGGHINFEGEQGSQVASSLLARAEEELRELGDVLPHLTSDTTPLRNRIEDQHAALSSSVDADTHRSVTEEARKIRQEVALLKISPENVEQVVTREVASAEVDFDEIRNMADEADIERYDRLVATARRTVREGDFDSARYALDEMRSIRFKIVSNQPEFLVGLFHEIAEEAYLAIDRDLHVKFVAAGGASIAGGDLDGLRAAIRGILNNRVSMEVSGAKIVELAHLLGS
ncbi:Hsp70 family protein [Rhizobium rhizogenes]|uniref:Hsp70 family protein n=1 Tax=Rhizobium rhizogenes TaxID=359 RepID=UPI00115E5662|nr:Hsp70 family protein [Rhizobium rhizogenes]TRB19690.1 Hsp70 family protein [Rhizobium rhizogenes]